MRHGREHDASTDALARRIVERMAPGEAREANAFVVQTALEHTYRTVARSVGSAGSHALLSRALGKARVMHPALRNVRIEGISELGIRGVSEMSQSHGEPNATGALQAVLEGFLVLLSNLIGDDLLAQLLEQATPDSLPNQKEAT
jgi:hypothetical protein